MFLELVARIAAITLFCGFAVYLTASAFVPSMETNGWDFLFIGFALLGLVVGAIAAAIKRMSDGKRPEAD